MIEANKKIGSKKQDLKYCAVVTDSASDIPKDLSELYNINVVPLYIHYNGQEYKDGININSEKIYSLQKEEKALFMSASPSPKDFIDVYEKLLKDYQMIISIHLSSKLSAVIKSAKIAVDLLKEKERIIIFDSLSGTMGTGFMAIAAARAVEKNYKFEKILKILEFLRDNTMLYGTIDTLKYLRRSGRVPALAQIATAALRIKPLLGIKNGVVEMIGLSVTRWGSLNEITRRAIRYFKKEKWVSIALIHTLSKTEAKKVMKRLQVALNCVQSFVVDCTPVVGAHTGPGLIGIIICDLERDIAELFI
jgi:DegV family protein with EDD domain